MDGSGLGCWPPTGAVVEGLAVSRTVEAAAQFRIVLADSHRANLPVSPLKPPFILLVSYKHHTSSRLSAVTERLPAYLVSSRKSSSSLVLA